MAGGIRCICVVSSEGASSMLSHLGLQGGENVQEGNEEDGMEVEEAGIGSVESGLGTGIGEQGVGMNDRVDESGGAEKDGVGEGVEEARMEESADRPVLRGDGESGKDVDGESGNEESGKDGESGRDVDSDKKAKKSGENRRYGTQRRSGRRLRPLYGKETQDLLQQLSEAERACKDN